jgi:lysophospholipase L1-like esterase
LNFLSQGAVPSYQSRMNSTPLFALIAFTLLAPFRAAIGAETNHNFGKWEKEIAAFEASDRTNPPPKHGLLFTGSSMIRRWKTLAQDYPNQPVVNRGVGGSENVDITHFADRIVFPYEPKMIFFRCGGNDIANGKSPEQVFADFKEFVAAVGGRLPETEIVFISWNATPLRWKQNDKEQAYNKMVKEFSTQTPHLKYCEMSDVVLDKDGKVRPELFESDKLHFNAEGNKLMAERVRPFLPK